MSDDNTSKGAIKSWISQTFDYPNWFISGEWIGVRLDEFLAQYVLHDSSLVGIWCMDDPHEITAFINWDISFYPEIIKHTEETFLIIRFRRCYSMRSLGYYATNVMESSISNEMSAEEKRAFLDGMMESHVACRQNAPLISDDRYHHYLADLEKHACEDKGKLFRTVLYNINQCMELIHDEQTEILCVDSEGNKVIVPLASRPSHR